MFAARAITISSLFVALTSCAPAASPIAPIPTLPASPPPPVEEVATQPPSLPPRPPPPVITTPMPGEPASVALAEARLTESSCEESQDEFRERTTKLIVKMRADVDASYRRWARAQPDCWEQYRWNEQLYRRPRGSHSYGQGIGEAFGAGGLGLSGIGSGGGGKAEGIGLGGLGTSGSGHRGAVGSSPSAPPSAASSASGTNNQVTGVDEADIVKTDGRFVYMAMNGALRIVEAMNPRVVSVTKVPGTVRELFVEGDRAVIYTASGGTGKRCTYGYDCMFAGDGTATRMLVFDISSRAAPKLLRQIDLSGSLMAARRIGATIHTVVADGDSPQPPYQTWPADLQTCGVRESIVLAKFARLKLDNERRLRQAAPWYPTIREDGREKALCNGLYRTARSDGGAFTTVVSFDLREAKGPISTATIQSRPGAVFASADALYLSVVQRRSPGPGRWYSFYPSVDEVSEIHKFRIGSSPKDTRYAGSGVVPGHVLNQFAMDEWYGYLRIATTRGRVPDPNVHSVVSVMAESENGNLVRVGAVDDIARGEDIRAVRFDGDRGYVVTFKKTDPLFVIDLYSPSRPVILGELKIPGFSTYMHRIDSGHLLSIGFDADDHGDFAYFDGVILQLFDVRNPTDPKLLHKERIGTRGSSSEAATDHLAFNYFSEKGLLAIPMTICEGGGDGRVGHELAFSGLLVYDVSVERGFRRLGGIDHGQKGASCSAWWSRANSVVKRSIFLDELVYSIATDRLKVQKMGQLGEDVADIALMP